MGVACPLVADALPAKSVVKVVRDKALSPPSQERLTQFRGLGKASNVQIRNFLQSFDQWSQWTSKKELSEQKKRSAANNGSIGMDVVRNKSGEFVCVPYPQGPAHKAGIQDGDVLIGMYTTEDVRSLSGPVGSTATFSVKRNLSSLSFTITRQKVTPPHVQFVQHNGFARIRIWRFDKKTPALFAKNLSKAQMQPIIFDLRGNIGGDIVSALTCAAELLPQGSVLGMAQMRTDTKSRSLTKKNRKAAKLGIYGDLYPLFIWQDELTASAAEAFILALVENDRAKNVGGNSFGKGQAQSVFFLDHNRLVLTTENLLSPQGYDWNNVGIRPSVITSTSLDNLIKVTADLLRMY